MRQAEEKLEYYYKEFYQSEGISEKMGNIEYLGINLSSDKSKLQFKLYYKDLYSRKEEHPIVTELKEMDMIRTLTQIVDTENGICRRYDIGLGNRTNEKMEFLMKRFETLASYCNAYAEEIRLMSQMKVCELPEYALASLYFWGFIEKENQIEAMKMHYLTRMCKNPDKIGKNIWFDDTYYLDYLEKTGILEFQQLLPVVKTAVTGEDGILWMIGTDYFRHGNHKYKIYFKIPQMILIKQLKDALAETGGACSRLSESLAVLEDWLTQHPELKAEGVAVCLDKAGCWSLNFYLKWME